MRALGPGSVSSFLKIILDVVYVALWVGIGFAALMALGAVIFDMDPALFSGPMAVHMDHQDESPPLITLGLFAVTAYLGAVQVIVERLRRIFATLTAGDPFHPDNVRRLQATAVMLGVLELAHYPMSLATQALTGHHQAMSPQINLSSWFAILVVAVLAEVFREGARLRREAELTI